MSHGTRLLWLWRRLRVMPPAEIAHRLGEALRTRLPDARRWPRPDNPLMRSARASAFLAAEAPRLFRPPLQQDAGDAARLLAGELPCFGRWVPWRPGGDTWHRDPFTGSAWPRGPSAGIAYRPGNPHGDVRVVWEINRLQQLFGLALIAADQPEHRDRAVGLLESQLADWCETNPPGEGVNYLSAMEEALRVVSLCHAFDLTRSWLSPATRDRLAELLARHAWHIGQHLSLYSSAGNHTIAEAVGLLYAGLLLRECPAAPGWQFTARRLLASEAARQVLPDGGGLEQATGYLLFITDLMGLAQALLAQLHEAPIPEMDAAVARARDFLNTLATGPADLPRIGDADDGWALSPALRLSWRAAPAVRQRSFPHAGLTVASFTGRDRLVFLHNPLGMPPSFGHGHADALSVLFTLDGTDLLIDPGTGQYGGNAEQRHYFRSSRAHNTATVADEDPARQLTAFMWADPHECRLEHAELAADHVLLLARHDGWRRFGITHWRAVSYRRNRYLAIQDWLQGPGTSPVQVRWHAGCPLAEAGGGFELRPPGRPPLALAIRGGSTRLLRGETTPPAGWRSPHYGEVIPCDTLEVSLPSGPQRQMLAVLQLDAVGTGADSIRTDFAALESRIRAN